LNSITAGLIVFAGAATHALTSVVEPAAIVNLPGVDTF